MMGDANFTNHINNEVHNTFVINRFVLYFIIFSNNFSSTGNSQCHMLGNIKTLTNTDEIKQIIKGINTKKSYGDDEISAYVMKKLPPVFYKLLAIIFNNCLSLGYFPKSWKNAKILPIPKPGKSPHDQFLYCVV